ncbi:1,4-alpha-glucan branching protein [Arthrobacter sp. MYb227]|nr:1,4-alpha-glucan branching protein [Arthrobacter sp. MYb227]
MDPTKGELLAAWMPKQSWFEGESTLSLRVVGGFRLDDPADEVGMEMILVLDETPQTPVLYHVPLSYRGAELEGAAESLLGTSAHGILGTRWIYDAAVDPVWQAQVKALIAGEVTAQHQNDSHVLDHSITVSMNQGTPTQDEPIASIIRRPVAGGKGSAHARAWVSAPLSHAENSADFGAVIELL